ncbi:hypothetical protein OZ401_005107 (plasmid) [Candidatus Chlorohelix allophototropha]|uniref:Uncharacterized protein n=1 Tax=Candidatus Chlorohelix allophototropha TaxID=3003348 RepID=A0ABY9BB61_9CHLR|nr:hypothetical protein OZ401_005107 [Chloroflexota bacterium L227-S17]
MSLIPIEEGNSIKTSLGHLPQPGRSGSSSFYVVAFQNQASLESTDLINSFSLTFVPHKLAMNRFSPKSRKFPTVGILRMTERF